MTSEQIDSYCKRLAEAWKKMPSLELSGIISEGLNIGLYRPPAYYMQGGTEKLITAIERMVEHGKNNN